MNNNHHTTLHIPEEETITALATAVGGAISIIRISGSKALKIAKQIWQSKKSLEEYPPRSMNLGSIIHKNREIDYQVLAVYFPNPNSFTGEDVVELHCHGGLLSARLILLAIMELGAKSAEPGEFSKRAFLNGRMDLTQAEAISDIIQAHSEAALHLANKQLQGLLGKRIQKFEERLSFIRSEIESRMDFPDEELDWIPLATLNKEFELGIQQIQTLLNSRHTGEILRNGIQLVIAGSPNVGKSSLMNAILGRDRAIVTNIPGTTRDTLEELAHIRSIPVRLIDTAGIRESKDTIEKTGIERSMDSIKTAQLILWVTDASKTTQSTPPTINKNCQLLCVINKCDLLPTTPKNNDKQIHISAATGEGLDSLYDAIEQKVWQTPHLQEPEIAVSERHAILLEDILLQLQDAKIQIKKENWELGAVALHTALHSLEQITGSTASVDILDNIFSRFCIGK